MDNIFCPFHTPNFGLFLLLLTYHSFSSPVVQCRNGHRNCTYLPLALSVSSLKYDLLFKSQEEPLTCLFRNHVWLPNNIWKWLYSSFSHQLAKGEWREWNKKKVISFLTWWDAKFESTNRYSIVWPLGLHWILTPFPWTLSEGGTKVWSSRIVPRSKFQHSAY